MRRAEKISICASVPLISNVYTELCTEWSNLSFFHSLSVRQCGSNDSWVFCPTSMGMCRCLFAAKRVLCMYVCTNAATMPYSSDKRNQTTVILAALHPDPQPKTDHKTPLLKRSTHKAIATQQPQTDWLLISCISYNPLLSSLPSSSLLFIEPRPPKDTPSGRQQSLLKKHSTRV